jgi:hypothetical protein
VISGIPVRKVSGSWLNKGVVASGDGSIDESIGSGELDSAEEVVAVLGTTFSMIAGDAVSASAALELFDHDSPRNVAFADAPFQLV